MKRSGIYKASNVTFNPETKEAYSYNWWRFVGIVDGLLVASNYRYSNTTGRHQIKVFALMDELGIKIDLALPLPRGVRHDQTIDELILEAEEHLFEKAFEAEFKRTERNAANRAKRAKEKLEKYLETQVHFRDYIIENKIKFGTINKVAVHQVVDADSIERDVENAIHNFYRDGFGSIVFYV